jgi:hypothetical protein
LGTGSSRRLDQNDSYEGRLIKTKNAISGRVRRKWRPGSLGAANPVPISPREGNELPTPSGRAGLRTDPPNLPSNLPGGAPSRFISVAGA